MVDRNYGEMSDEKVIDLVRSGQTDAAAFILNKYKGMVRKKARGLYLIGGECEDLIQEGMIGLFEAIQKFDKERDVSFYKFADLCVTRQLYTAVKASQRKKHGPLNSYVSLYSDTMKSSEEEGVSLAELLPAQKSAEELFIDRENAAFTEKEIWDKLSRFERKVLELYLLGIGYAKIAEILDKDQKSVDNALQRIKTKTRKLMALLCEE